jgi:hypothetical protein
MLPPYPTLPPTGETKPEEYQPGDDYHGYPCRSRPLLRHRLKVCRGRSKERRIQAAKRLRRWSSLLILSIFAGVVVLCWLPGVVHVLMLSLLGAAGVWVLACGWLWVERWVL